MAGFLDSQQQIIDMVLTSRGKMLLSQGELRFVYWAAYDDEIVYGLSGSLTEDPLQIEAKQGYKFFNFRGNDNTNVNHALITVPPGWDVIPTGSVTFDKSSITMNQQPVVQEFYQSDDDGNSTDAYSSSVNMGVVRFDSTTISVNAEYSKESYPKKHLLEGFYVKVLASGSNGYIQQHHTLNDNSEIVAGAELKIDTESPGEI